MLLYTELEVWKTAMLLVKEIYSICRNYPNDEMYSLISQTKRAAVSIPANIAEGLGRNFKKDTVQFLHISRGSLYELETLLNIGLMVNYVKEEELAVSLLLIQEEKKLLNGFIRSIEQRNGLK